MPGNQTNLVYVNCKQPRRIWSYDLVSKFSNNHYTRDRPMKRGYATTKFVKYWNTAQSSHFTTFFWKPTTYPAIALRFDSLHGRHLIHPHNMFRPSNCDSYFRTLSTCIDHETSFLPSGKFGVVTNVHRADDQKAAFAPTGNHAPFPPFLATNNLAHAGTKYFQSIYMYVFMYTYPPRLHFTSEDLRCTRPAPTGLLRITSSHSPPAKRSPTCILKTCSTHKGSVIYAGTRMIANRAYSRREKCCLGTKTKNHSFDITCEFAWPMLFYYVPHGV